MKFSLTCKARAVGAIGTPSNVSVSFESCNFGEARRLDALQALTAAGFEYMPGALAIEQAAASFNAQRLSEAVINDGASYGRRKSATLTALRGRADWAASLFYEMCNHEARSPLWEGERFTEQDKESAAYLLADYMVIHCEESGGAGVWAAELSHGKTHSNLFLCCLTEDQHARTCGYWYTVTECGSAYTAFRTRAALETWIRRRGLTLAADLPDEMGTFAAMEIRGKFRTHLPLYLTRAEFDAIPGERFRDLENGEYTEAVINPGADGVADYWVMNPNCKDRAKFDGRESTAIADSGI